MKENILLEITVVYMKSINHLLTYLGDNLAIYNIDKLRFALD